MKRADLPAAIACLLVHLCSLERACASNDTTVAAALEALAYVPAANAANTGDAANARPSVFATRPSPAAALDGQPNCVFDQMTNLTGHWVNNSSPSSSGFYNASSGCPNYINEFNCQNPEYFVRGQPTGSRNVSQTFIDSENSQVFLPDNCSLRSLEPARFNDQMAGRRMIFLGDSLMRGNWQSLACWLADQIVNGSAGAWEDFPKVCPGDYTVRWGGGAILTVRKQYIGNFTLKSGGMAAVRDHSWYNESLYDDIMAEFQPLTNKDILVISYGGWYERFQWDTAQNGWLAFKDHMNHLVLDRLKRFPGQVIWKEYTPQHFGGPFGFDPGVGGLVGGNFQYGCQPASVGEFWYDDFMRDLILDECGDDCKHVKILPIFEMTRQRPNAHFGAFGDNAEKGNADCKHYCLYMSDWWNTVLYNMIF